jgi:hypothetical protein
LRFGLERGELGDRLVERGQLTEAEFLDLASGAPVAVDHNARAVAGAIGDPRLGATVRKAKRDERRPKIVDPNLTTRRCVLEERRSIDFGFPQVPAEAHGGTIDVHAPRRRVLADVRLDEHKLTVLGARSEMLSPELERFGNPGIQSPSARVVGLVLVELHRAALKVEIGERQTREFAASHSFPGQNGVEQAIHEGDVRAGQKLRVFVGVQVLEGLFAANPRQKPNWDRAPRNDSARVGTEFEHARHELRDVPTRRRREFRR